MKKRILILIDAQNDFIDGGRLGVDGSKAKMDALSKYIRESKGKYDMIIASVDWHPFTHCSFKDNGGIWPMHCLQHSDGAAIYQPILDAINDAKIELHVFTKGTDEDREEYSVMKNIKSNNGIHSIIEHNGTECVDFTGIADIYCVKDSMEDFHREFPNVKINVLTDFVGNMDEAKFKDYLEKSDFIEFS